MKVRLLKLINNERINKKLVSAKACDATSEDICYEEDNAECTVYAYDECNKDYAGCTKGADDVCTYEDHAGCSGAGVEDNCSSDWSA